MQLNGFWEYETIKEGEEHLNHLLFQLETPPESGAEPKQPLAVMLVLDKSWSMNGIKLESTIGFHLHQLAYQE